jgi:hypothetical protein
VGFFAASLGHFANRSGGFANRLGGFANRSGVLGNGLDGFANWLGAFGKPLRGFGDIHPCLFCELWRYWRLCSGLFSELCQVSANRSTNNVCLTSIFASINELYVSLA